MQVESKTIKNIANTQKIISSLMHQFLKLVLTPQIKTVRFAITFMRLNEDETLFKQENLSKTKVNFINTATKLSQKQPSNKDIRLCHVGTWAGIIQHKMELTVFFRINEPPRSPELRVQGNWHRGAGNPELIFLPKLKCTDTFNVLLSRLWRG